MSTDQQLSQTDLATEAPPAPAESFEEVVRLHQADVRIMTRRHLGRTVQADEVAQEVFVQVFRGLAGFRGECSLRTWILGVTRNQIRLHIRNEVRRRRRTERTVAPEILDAETRSDDPDPFHLPDADEELRALQDCLQRLDARQQSLIQAYYFQQQTAESLAEKSGQSAGAVRMLLMRIRKRLGLCIQSKVSDFGKGNT